MPDEVPSLRSVYAAGAYLIPNWSNRMLSELWIGDATEIARKRERKQKTDRQNAQHILRLG